MNETNKKVVGAAMVVGGGITGMQSALDLANSGYKVYLVEKSTSIGGRMAQLDKTFPTNDCSMCMISPKLIEVAKHRNIELLTNTDVESVAGQAGNFNIKVKTQARYIDLLKCSGCGDCITACPVDLKNEFEQGLSDRKAVYKKYPQAIPGVVAITKDKRPPCKINCPAGCNGQGYVALTSKGKYQEAFDHIMQWIPLPASVGRVCHHPCEQACNRAQIEAPIGIAPIKAFVADTVRAQRQNGNARLVEKVKVDPSRPKVAIVGAGPSGLTAAYDLVKKGYPVTIFEASSLPGGQMQWAIPRYRLPKEALAADIKDIIDLGIDLQLNFPIGEKFTLDDIKARGYKAIYLAIGTQKNSQASIPGDKLKGVIPALEFLKSTILGEKVELGQKLVIVGGGNVAMDCARSAIRLGKDVTVVYRRTKAEMPANSWEIAEAEEEGVKIENSWGPKEVIGQDGKVVAMEFQKFVSTKPGDRSSAPSFDSSVTKRIECDNVILAIGQTTDLSIFAKKTKVKTSKNGLIIADPLTLATDEPGIFAGGDGVSGPKSAVEAIAHGHEAAVSIERYLTGQDLKAGREKVEEPAAGLPEGKFTKQARVPLRMLPIEKRVSSFDEAAIMYSEEEARKEADRCLNCGLCSECMQCVAACKANAVDHSQKDEVLDLNVG